VQSPSLISGRQEYAPSTPPHPKAVFEQKSDLRI
jgi:hypothetical protein